MVNLMLGHCLELMKEIPDGSVDAVICDPPYGTTACKWDSVIPLDLMWAQLKRVIKLNGAIVLFGSEPFSSALRMSNIKMYKYDWVYEKTNAKGFLSAKRMPLRSHENISVFYFKQPTYSPQKWVMPEHLRTKRKSATRKNTGDVYGNGEITRRDDDGSRHPTSVIGFSNRTGRTGNYHPTQKPIALMEYLIKTYTNEGETVLDFTMGSGTTGVACVNTDRKFIGIEMDEGYFKIAEDRLNDALDLLKVSKSIT